MTFSRSDWRAEWDVQRRHRKPMVHSTDLYPVDTCRSRLRCVQSVVFYPHSDGERGQIASKSGIHTPLPSAQRRTPAPLPQTTHGPTRTILRLSSSLMRQYSTADCVVSPVSYESTVSLGPSRRREWAPCALITTPTA